MTTDSPTLRQLAVLDPASQKVPTSPAIIEQTRRWVLEHDRLEQERATAQGTPIRRTRRRVAVVGAAAVMVLGMVGVLPNVLGDAGTAAPAAAIPMLGYSQPGGVDGTSELQQLAQQLRGSSAAEETGRYYFERRHYVGYMAHEVEVSPEYWEIDRLEPREDHVYFWFDTTDRSGGQLYLMNGEAIVDAAIPAGEVDLGQADVADTPQALYDLRVLTNEQHQRFPGHYLISDYQYEANLLGSEGRATFLDAIALAPDVTSYGQVTDREGRDGVAFGASRFEEDEGESVEIEVIMILDPTTGKVLETDTIYPNDLPGAPDVVEEYDLVVESQFTDTLPPCGDDVCPGAGAATE
ncbi:hypothetical protein MF406_06465 [Georgenia sp. TF02-10]|uniref:hypothetical protein n=1 Tax=Georgenia sp. TF02-10 TaxID=2917725 RepID=UPI001FA755F4|nr:hypothetical protein [Georgenia sp. TF02-10]UNX55868.1 hypothetical protein MF406_06465 [Georgenia sp. TF02-10]